MSPRTPSGPSSATPGSPAAVASRAFDEAQRVLAEAFTKKKSNARFQAKAPTIGEYAEHWIVGLRLQNSPSRATRRSSPTTSRHTLPAQPARQPTATRIAAHYRQVETSGRRDKPGYGKPLSANTVSKVHVLLAAMLDAAVDDGLILLNPAKKKRTVNPPSSSQVRAQKPEIVTWTGPQLHAFLIWNRDDLEDELFPRCGAPSPTPALAVIKAYKAERGAISLKLARADAYVFGNDAGEIRSPNEGRRWTSRVQRAQAELCELPRVTLKGLRAHTRDLAARTWEHPKVAQERLGHSTITTTMNIYSHVTPTMQKAAMDRFAAHLDEA